MKFIIKWITSFYLNNMKIVIGALYFSLAIFSSGNYNIIIIYLYIIWSAFLIAVFQFEIMQIKIENNYIEEKFLIILLSVSLRI